MTDIVTTLISFIGVIFEFINYLISDIGIILGIFTDPFLFLMFFFTASHFYTILVSRTRKDIVINYFKFFGLIFSAGYKVILAIVPLVIGLLQTLSTIIQGALSNPGVGSVSPGAIMATAILIILALYAVFNF